MQGIPILYKLDRLNNLHYFTYAICKLLFGTNIDDLGTIYFSLRSGSYVQSEQRFREDA